jgi:hypothetical protein
MHPTKLRCIWQSGFRGEDFLEITPQTILVSDWLISKKSSPLKPLCQMNRNLVGCIYGRFSIKIAHFVEKIYKNWPIRNKNCR